LVLCTAMLLSLCPNSSFSAPAVYAQGSVEDLTAQKEALAAEQALLAQQRDETASSLEEQKLQDEIIRKQIEAKSEEIGINQALLAALEEAIASKTAGIAAQDSAIAALDKEIAQQQADLRVQLRGISQKNGVLSVLQLILNSSTYTEYLIGFKVSEQISQRNEQLLMQLEQNIQAAQNARNTLKTDKAALEIEHSQAAAVQAELENGKAHLQQLYNESHALSEQMEQNVEYLNEQIAVMEQEQAYMQSTIEAIKEQIRLEEEAKRREEEEKRRQEEEEQKRLEEEQRREEEENGDNESSDDESSDDESSDDDEDPSEDTGSDGEDGTEDENDPEDDPEDDSEDDPEDDSENDSEDSSLETMLWPAPTCLVITSSFKLRDLEEDSAGAKWHNGVDIACYGDAEGEPIIAAASGKVRVSNRYDSYGGGYGYYTTIDHGYDSYGRRIITLYAHCSEVLVYEGQEVEAGEVIGYVGNTGNSYGAHLHFEVLVDFVAVDPTDYLDISDIDILG